MFVMGLGNPGQRYVSTRHNAGFRAVDILMQEQRIVFRRQRFSLVYQANIPGNEMIRPIIFIRWSGYMNDSGGAISYLRRKYAPSPENFYAVVDNMDLPPGICRIKEAGGNAGHNGLKSLIHAFGVGTFKRIYIGIGHPEPGYSVVEHVLGKPAISDAEAIEKACTKASTAIWALRDTSFERVAEVLNRRETD